MRLESFDQEDKDNFIRLNMLFITAACVLLFLFKIRFPVGNTISRLYMYICTHTCKPILSTGYLFCITTYRQLRS